MAVIERAVAARASAFAAICSCAIILAVAINARAAGDKSYVMKISLATVNDVLHQFAKDYAAAVEKDSGGRIKIQIYPASQLGSVAQQSEGVQFGAIQCQIVPPEFYVGIDERFEVLATPGLVTSMTEGQRLAANPAVRKLMLGLGADKGLHGVGLFMVARSSIISRSPIRHLADFKGKRIRIFASQFQSVAMRRLGAVPKAMNLADVLPALQDNAVDGALAATFIFTTMHYQTAAKYVTEIGQPAVFAIVEISKRWYDSLPPDLQKIVDQDAAAESAAIDPQVLAINGQARKDWIASGGELIDLPADEQSSLLKILAGVGDEVSATKPQLSAAYKIITDAAK